MTDRSRTAALFGVAWLAQDAPLNVMRVYKAALIFVGTLCLAATVIHGAWLWYMPNYAELQSMNTLQLDTMLMLNAAITLFLFFTGIATLAVARTRALSLPHVRGFTLILMGFWAGRFLLELVMPLQIPLAFIHDPSVFAKSFMAVPVVALLVPALVDLRHSAVRSASAQNARQDVQSDSDNRVQGIGRPDAGPVRLGQQ